MDDHFDVAVAQSFASCLSDLLGREVLKPILMKLRNNFGIEPVQICGEANKIPGVLDEIFGTARPVVLRSFLRRLYADLDIPLNPIADFEEALDFVKRRFESHGTVLCQDLTR